MSLQKPSCGDRKRARKKKEGKGGRERERERERGTGRKKRETLSFAHGSVLGFSELGIYKDCLKYC